MHPLAAADGQADTQGTPNFWSHGAYDAKLGVVYLPLGNATPDFWGEHRTEAMNKYATTVVALKADTGREAWHFQTARMDTWDDDNGTPHDGGPYTKLPDKPTLIYPATTVVSTGAAMPTIRAPSC